ncbi:hypothetical protein RJ640_015313 [Escallonia rubra]|uniref:RING-CH-type domain-containing protein n=1 Tax=Escallonia rubra TaxID=112253 RepID=A0AA88QVU4_9ASTE|nr:hypothetical protein RJ640_015313 [Escallonia rubra]
MSATEASTSTDIESGEGPRRHRRRRRKRRRPSLARSSSETTTATTDGSHCFSGDSDDHSWHSPRNSAASRSLGGCGSFSSSEEVDLESGDLEVKVHLGKREERDCRICHSRLVGGGGGHGDGGAAAAARAGFELGCDCKGDMGAAHRQCAETWFKIKGNTTCEICGATALNVAGEQSNEASNATGAAAANTAPTILPETRSFWHGRRIMNFLLACMVFAFIVSWLFHFNVLPA